MAGRVRPAEEAPSASAPGEPEEEDYMAMSFDEPAAAPKYEPSARRAARLKKEAEERGKVKSKKELAAEAARAREAALQTRLDSSNRGFRMLSKLGYAPGATLGKARPGAAEEPLRVSVKEDRGGIGLDAERKRRLRDAAESATKRVREGEDGFRGRVAAEAAARRVTAQLVAAQAVAEQFGGGGPGGASSAAAAAAAEAEAAAAGAPTASAMAAAATVGPPARRLLSVDVRWRGPVRERLLRERALADKEAVTFRRDNEMHVSDGRRPVYLADESEDDDDDDVLAYGKGRVVLSDVDELDLSDPELDAFNALPAEERLAAVVVTLRERWRYCFWCKSSYPTAEMEGCPGLLEEDHE